MIAIAALAVVVGCCLAAALVGLVVETVDVVQGARHQRKFFP